MSATTELPWITYDTSDSACECMILACFFGKCGLGQSHVVARTTLPEAHPRFSPNLNVMLCYLSDVCSSIVTSVDVGRHGDTMGWLHN